jgi:hypothetical protein
MTGILAIFILKEASFSEGRLVGMLIGLAGLPHGSGCLVSCSAPSRNPLAR